MAKQPPPPPTEYHIQVSWFGREIKRTFYATGIWGALSCPVILVATGLSIILAVLGFIVFGPQFGIYCALLSAIAIAILIVRLIRRRTRNHPRR
ncbi:MAG: hypothetical protein JWN01_879 [Patescibacteria group bacterium]|nr:hypothetical protein [Patescibacteria group bacterium]